MKARPWCSLVAVLLCAAVPAAAETVVEAWRGSGYTGPVSVNPADGSCWVAGDMVHLSASGAELWRGEGLYAFSLSVNSSDGSCWVADTGNSQVVHISADGQQLWRGGYFVWPTSVSVNSSDASCWVGDAYRDSQVVHLSVAGVTLWEGSGFGWAYDDVSVDPTDGSCWVAPSGPVVHLSADGTELWRSAGFPAFDYTCAISVNPADGSCWVADIGTGDVVHLSASGVELWRGDAFGPSGPLDVSANHTDGSCWVCDGRSQVVHLSATGQELWRGGGFYEPFSVSVNPTDGSCWVGDRDGVVHLVIVDGATPFADFTATPLSGVAPLTVQFTDRSTGAPTSWSWAFGDGGGSSDQNPSHTYASDGNFTVTLTASNAAGSDTETKAGYIQVGPAGFEPYVVSVEAVPDPPTDGGLYGLTITVGNRGGAAGSVMIALSEYNLSGIAMADDYFSPNPPIATKTIQAFGEAKLHFLIRHRWDWIAAPPATWQAILDGAISCLPIGLIQEWADGIRAAGALGATQQVYGYTNNLIQAYGIASGLLREAAEFRYLPGAGTTPGLTFDHTVTVRVPDWKANAFWTSTGHSVAGTICSYAGSRAGVLGLPLLAFQGVLKYAAHEYYEIAYDPDPDYTVLPGVESIAYPELDALPDSAGKAAALAARAWAEVETARAQALVKMAAAEEAGDEYWRLRQAQAAEEFGQAAAARMAECQRLLPAVPGLQAGGSLADAAAFRSQLQTDGLPSIERDFLLRQGWSEEELDALVQSMLDTADGVYTTTGLQADAMSLSAGGTWAQTTLAADITESPKEQLQLPTTVITASGSLGRDGSYVSDVQVQLEATTPTATAVAALEYSLDDGATWTPYGAPITISQMGATTALARATDALGQVETPPARRVITRRPSVFSDVSADDWAWPEVEAAYWAGIAVGYPNGTYLPGNQVTRDQMAVYLSRAIGIPTGSVSVADYQPTQVSFTDVPAGHWAYRYVEYCSASGIVQGYPGGAYHPGEVVNRGQMAVYVARAMVTPTGDAAIPDPEPPFTFPDVPGADSAWAWCHKHVEYLAARSVVQGYADNTYRPGNAVTRDQMAVYVARAFQLPM